MRNMRPVSVLKLLNLLRTFLPLAYAQNRVKIKNENYKWKRALCPLKGKMILVEWGRRLRICASSVLLLELKRRQRAVI